MSPSTATGDRPVDRPPARTDVVVVGSGYTGMSAALELSRRGREVVVLDVAAPGAGASSRNAGHLSHVLKAGFIGLARRYGTAAATSLCAEGVRAREFGESLIEHEQITCDLTASGRFVAAITGGHYDAMGRQIERMRRHVGIDGELVPRAEQHREIGSDRYAGGQIQPDIKSLHPAKLLAGLSERAIASGARVHGHTGVRSIARTRDGHDIDTTAGPISARCVVLATNGYTGSAVPWFRRRVIPFRSSMIATEPLPPETVHAALPGARLFTDSARLLYHARVSPDRRRILFGATGVLSADPVATAARLSMHMEHTFPALCGTRVEHSWSGYVGFTFDGLPHIGEHDGIHYAMGYGGSGIAMGMWLGYKMAQRIVGGDDAGTAFDGRAFPSRFFYRGRPWFVPLAVAGYRLRDRRE